ncbi:MAG: HAD-IA family hydrolase [Polyangia bacterium]
MALDALIFDIDGTLLDTNDLHVEAWRQTLEQHGYTVASDRIEQEIGKGGDKLVPSLLGRSLDKKDGDRMRKLQPERFAELARSRGVRAFPGAVELLREARRRGLKVVLATSSQKAHVRVLGETSGIDLEREVDHLVTADDAAESKPAPDLVEAAVQRLGLSPAQCAMVGDTLYDMEAAKHAGVIGLGVQTGYQPPRELLRNGARAAWKSTKELYAALDEVLRIASPSELRPTQAVLEALMREALREAEAALAQGEIPIGCVLANGRGEIIGRGFNQQTRTRERTAHAEMVVFRSVAGRMPDESAGQGSDGRDHILVSTLEPCVMCTGAAMEAAIDTILYALEGPADSGTGRVLCPESPASQMPRIVGGVLRGESRALLERFVKVAKDPMQKAFTEQLLELAPTRGPLRKRGGS